MMKIGLFFLFAFCCQLGMAQENCPALPTQLRLFYIQRTGNSDTIVYDANLTADGGFNKTNPIHIYWHRSRGVKEELNYLQRTKGYGVKFSPSDRANEYLFRLVAYPQRWFRLLKDACGEPAVLLSMSGRDVYLNRIYIQLEPTAFGLKPTIHYIEIFGVDVQTGGMAYEKLVP